MKRIAWRTILPALLAIALFSGVAFLYLLPTFDRAVRDQKQLMIRELTESSWNILARFEAEEQAGHLSRTQAQQEAIAQVRSLHYGQQSKDYFWIIDNHPTMVVHPYRPDLEGQDLSEFTDPGGKRLFVEMAEIVARDGAGYVAYQWQWQDDAQRIVPKLSYVKGFAPWGWIIGTGVYTDDVDAEISGLRAGLQTAVLLILAVVSLLLVYLLRTGYLSEAGRLRTASALQESEAKYRSLVESAGESILMAIAGEGLYANASLLHLLGFERAEFADLEVDDILQPTAQEKRNGQRLWQAVAEGRAAPSRGEAELTCRDGTTLRVMLTLSRIVVQGRAGFMAVATRLSQPRELDLQSATSLDDLEAASRRTRDLAALMMNHGADAVQVSEMLSASADGVVRKAIELIVAELGPAPVPFDVMLMGSLGRSEVTLFADQDHAIIFADVPPQDALEVQDYFLQVGARLADLLAGSGYPYCDGHIMASEEACCQSLSAWQGTFNNWLNSLDAEDLLRAKIFFDFRSALLEGTLVPALQEHLRLAMANRPLFFPLLAHNILNFEPPLNALGNIVNTDFSGGRRGFDIKGVVAQLVDVARLRALQYGVGEAGTLARLEALASGAHLSPVTAAETIASYRLLLTVRLRHQAHCRANHLSVDNIVTPDNLPPETQLELKQALHQLKALKNNLQHEFGNRP